MFKKVVIPIILIFISTLFSVFFSNKFENHNMIMFAVFTSGIYGVGAYSISKYIIEIFKLKYIVFSKKEHIIEILIVSCVSISFLTGYFITYFGIQNYYYYSELRKYGTVPKGIVVSSKYRSWKSSKIVYIYEYYVQKSIKYQNTTIDDNIRIGDSLEVYYSSKNPDLHRIVKL